MERMISGIKPTGSITLGNYIGAIKNFVALQDEYEMFIFVANLHAITVDVSKKDLKNNTVDLVALYLACGLDPNKVVIFNQSDVMPHTQLAWILQCQSYMGELSRMTQYKDKLAKESNIGVGLFTYPVLMASDILMYDPKYVPVGDDQKQHVELTRDLAQRFNNKHGDTFTIPEPVTVKVGKRIMSLSNPLKKMSKSDSDKGDIFLLDDLKAIEKKIRSAVTDSEGKVYFDQENKPGISNLLTIYSVMNNEPIEDIVARYTDKGYAEFKNDLALIVSSEIKKIQDRYHEIIASDQVNEVLEKGAAVANKIAYKKLMKVQNKLGINITKR